MQEEPLPASELKYRDAISTNQVLVEQPEKEGKPTTYYLPTYIRCKVKDIDKLDIGSLEASIKATILITFYYGSIAWKGIMEKIFGEDAKKLVLLQFNQMESIQLKEDKGITMKHIEKKHQVQFIIRAPYVTELEGEVFLSPFEILNLMLSITLQPVHFEEKDGFQEPISIKFNCMDSTKQKNLDHGSNCKLGNYTLAPVFLESRFTRSDTCPFKPTSVLQHSCNKGEPPSLADDEREPLAINKSSSSKPLNDVSESKNQLGRMDSLDSEGKKKPQKSKHYQYAHFRIPMYKYPGTSLITIFIPLWLLGFINMAVFFQDAGLADRIASIATLALAYVAFIPTINESIPETPSMLLVEILILIQTAATVLTLVQSIRGRDSDYTANRYEWEKDGFFISVIILNCITVLTELILFALHKLWWEPLYLTKKNYEIEEEKLDRKHWENPECDLYFQQLIDSGKRIKPLPEPEKKPKPERQSKPRLAPIEFPKA